MSTVSNLLTTFNIPNYVGELFGLTPLETPFLSMIGGLTGGGRRTDSKEFAIQSYELPSATQPNIAEGADATFSGVDRAQTFNVVQIFQEGVEVSYTKQAAVGNVSAANVSILGTQPVQSELDWQIQRKIEKIARDVEYTFLNGTYNAGENSGTPRKTRGLLTAITTNATAAGTAALTKELVDGILLKMYDSGAPMTRPVIFVNGWQKQMLSGIYGYAPTDRNMGGVNVNQIETDFGTIGVVLARHMPTTALLVADVAYCKPVILFIPGKGFLFREPLAKSGSADKEQIYGEIGLDYGPELWHGKITGLTDS